MLWFGKKKKSQPKALLPIRGKPFWMTLPPPPKKSPTQTHQKVFKMLWRQGLLLKSIFFERTTSEGLTATGCYRIAFLSGCQQCWKRKNLLVWQLYCIVFSFFYSFFFFLQHSPKLHGANPPLRHPREQVASPLAAKIPINFRCSWQKRTLRTRTVITLSCWRHSQGEAAQGPKRTRGDRDRKKKAQKNPNPCCENQRGTARKIWLGEFKYAKPAEPQPPRSGIHLASGGTTESPCGHIATADESRVRPPRSKGRAERKGVWGDGASSRSWIFLLRAIFYASLHHRPGVRGTPAHRPPWWVPIPAAPPVVTRPRWRPEVIKAEGSRVWRICQRLLMERFWSFWLFYFIYY